MNPNNCSNCMIESQKQNAVPKLRQLVLDLQSVAGPQDHNDEPLRILKKIKNSLLIKSKSIKKPKIFKKYSMKFIQKSH